MAKQSNDGDMDDLIQSDGYLRTSGECSPAKRSRLEKIASLFAAYSKNPHHRGMALRAESTVEADKEEILQSLIISVNRPFPNGRVPLSQAVANEDGSLVKILLEEEDIDVNAPDEDGKIPLWRALECFAKSTDNWPQNFSTIPSGDPFKNISNWTALQQGFNQHASSRFVIATTQQLSVPKPIITLFLERKDLDTNQLNDEGETTLTWAVKNRKPTVLKHLLAKAVFDSNCPNRQSRTPLSLAAEAGDMGMVDVLLNQPGIDANCKDDNGRTPLAWSVLGRHLATMKTLLSHDNTDSNIPDSNGRTALSLAAETAESTIIQRLLEEPGIEVDRQDDLGRSPLSWVVRRYGGNDAGFRASSTVEIVNLFLKLKSVNANLPDREGRTPFSWAVTRSENTLIPLHRNENLDVVKCFIKSGVVELDKRDKSGRTPLSWCAEKGPKEVLETLLQEESIDVNSRDKENRTPLFWAASRKGNDTCMRLLSKHDSSTLHIAAKTSPGLVKVLLTSGYDKNTLDSNNLPALYYAVEAGNLESTELLISPESVNKEDTAGRTPLKLAVGRRNPNIVKLLVDNLAQVDELEPADWFKVNHDAGTQIACLSRQENTQSLSMLTMNQFEKELEMTPLGSGIRRRLFLFKGSLPLWRQYDQFLHVDAPKDDRLDFKFPSPDFPKSSPQQLRFSLATSFPIEYTRRDPDFPKSSPQELRFTLATSFPIKYTRRDPDLIQPTGQFSHEIMISYKQRSYYSKPESKDFFSTLDSSKIPDDGAQFLNQFITTLEERWVRLLKVTEKHLRENRRVGFDRKTRGFSQSHLVQESVTSETLITELQGDFSNLNTLRNTLGNHVDQVQACLKQYCNAQEDGKHKEQAKEAIKHLDMHVTNGIEKIEQFLRDLLSLNFAVASVAEARRSAAMAKSMKQLTWMTIFFLPVMCASVSWTIPKITVAGF
ncbi:ankyrin repeat-containing domain protein [Fusarium flagelliforme]|uniref:ankyrin repeat-containing domain protein n=1 Tax=Fusarium flagelliforme TaxID=2675880 RepID=UPI001E8D2513|nr:ankyrin repeat-containing domain protein [Fusarium flagelliforme]KAH7173989.1 ankyrin repeat-containing domain protein [Fusarium flagelliforme]